ncbi:LysR substrate-binding domain-containing protein [Rhizobium sp. BR 362]|uniref:LysR substrate-binding domain-containing protein n=1 Tax=Rhizobium sp. BR 362 TaxID=3040670 RepID=UPI002F406E97
MEEAIDAMASPIRELRRLYRDAEAKAARLRLIVDVRSMLDRAPWEATVGEVLSAIAAFAGANTASIRSQTGEIWQCAGQAGSSQSISDIAETKFMGTAWMAEEQLELRLSKTAFPIHDDDRKTIKIVADQLAAFLKAERQHAVRERLTFDLQARERELARLVEAMIGAQEQERRPVAYDLHDGVAQSLVSLLFHLEAAGVATHAMNPAKQAIEGVYAELLGGLRRGEIDFLIGAMRNPLPIDDVEQETLFNDIVVIVSGKRHPLVGKDSICIGDLASYPWVVATSGTPIRTHFDALFQGRSQGPRSVVESSSLILMRELLDQTDHLGFVSGGQAAAEIKRGLMTSLPFDLTHTERPIGITMRRGVATHSRSGSFSRRDPRGSGREANLRPIAFP